MQMASRVQTDEDAGERSKVWILDQKLDQPMEEEAKRLRNMYKEKKFSASMVLQLAFQSLGVVYGDLGTSPLYVFYNTFPSRIEDPEDVIGALSLIIYSLSLVPLLKYVFIVCRANDNGQGGTFALYSLLCRHANIKIIPNQDRTDEELTTYSRSVFPAEQSFAARTKRWLEGNAFKKNALLVLVLIGTCMVIGDGILTPAISVCIYRYFRRGGRDSWTSLGGIMLSITGTEALFADLSHFPVSSIQIAFTVIVFPCLLLAYSGQAAYLLKNPDNVGGAFYHSIPDSIYWPVFLVATAAAVVASQATISATFSLVKQALALGCFPRVKVVHTSKTFPNQIYIPDINWILMILCIAVTAGFRNQTQIGNASGTAVVIVMLVTTFLMTLIMILVWRCHWIIVLIFTGLSLVVECTYFSAVLLKVNQGGWVPLVIAAAFYIIMYVWHYGTVKRFETELHSKVSMAWILGLGPSLGLVRVPGIGLVYTELASGVPHIFSHFITNLPAIHSVVVFVCVKYLPVHKVPEEERFLVKRIGPKKFHMFRCVARYGYQDLHKKDHEFEKKLFDNLFLFARYESLMEGGSDSDLSGLVDEQTAQSGNTLENDNGNTVSSEDSIVPINSSSHASNTIRSYGQASSQIEIDELEFLNTCRDVGVVHILGNSVVKARRDSKFFKKIAIDYIYAFLRKICRENSAIFNVPQESLLNVGQILYV
ncbi:potassium transporter 11-like isoform X2 [Alnus glutinosa]|uniref:potassium transporter 11-like isoform X2 n=1 Tax=Alnus glutinosa TaxID=3517 RepID=UPI002D79EED8|nr:potassium transporter 11-like isoform X2 [Alnus glutinosa]